MLIGHDQSALYAGATPAGGWFATCTSAGMGGAMGATAVTAVAATAGVAVAAGVGYLIYQRMVGNNTEAGETCPWCVSGSDGGNDGLNDDGNRGTSPLELFKSSQKIQGSRAKKEGVGI